MPDQDENQDEFTSDQFAELRDRYKQMKSENKQLLQFKETVEPTLRNYALKEAGFQPESPQAKALLKLHEGDFTAEALAETASEYGIASGSGDTDSEGEGGTLDEVQQQNLSSADRAARLEGQGQTSDPQSPQERYNEAEQKGDLQGMVAAQNEIARIWHSSNA